MKKNDGSLFFLGETEKEELSLAASNCKSKKEVARKLGLNPRQVEYLIKEKMACRSTNRQGLGGGAKNFPDPTPQEIKKLCKEIQSTWTPEIEAERRAGSGKCTSVTKLKEEGLRYGRKFLEPVSVRDIVHAKR
jgi:hypothetical protein